MAVSLEQFVRQLEDSGIIAGETLKDFIPPKSSPNSAVELAKDLVRQKKLTKFQVEEVSKGKGKSLTLGNYVLLEKIGQGGMGAVYRAQHRRMKRIVAIKMLPPSMINDAAAAARFQREVEAAARLRHPNIVAADDADEANGVHFLVMECVEGDDLSSLVKKDGPLPVNQAAEYVMQAAQGLQAAHAEGIIHRDIKPSNLLLDKKGTVKVLDMGLARIESSANVATQAELTGTGAIMGTVDYMPPEQALSTKHADARADIYSLGCSLWYLLTARPIYDGESITAKLLAHQSQPIPSLRSIRSEVQESLDSVFRKMVAKNVEDRYQTMTDVIAALKRSQAATKTDAEEIDANPSDWSPSSAQVAEESAFQATIVGNNSDVDGTDKSNSMSAGTGTLNASSLRSNGRRSNSLNTGKTKAANPKNSKSKQVIPWWQDRRIQIATGVAIACAILLAFVIVSTSPEKTRTSDASLAGNAGATSNVKVASISPQSQPRASNRDAVTGTSNVTDLLTKIDFQRDALEGVWHRDGNGLVSPVQPDAQIALPPVFPKEYRLVLNVVREAGNGPLVIGLPVGTTRCAVMLDAGGIAHANSLGDLKSVPKGSRLSSTFDGFERGRAVLVECKVTDDSISISLDGHESLHVSDDVQGFSTPIRWSTIELQTPFLAVPFSRFRIQRLEVEPISSSKK
jgi:serine/threonine protein kinase